MKAKSLFVFKHLLVAVALVLLLLALPDPALAHKVSIFAWVEGDTVHTLSKFSGGKRVKKGTVTVYDTAGKKLLEGQTNAQGEFSFKVPAQTALQVVLAAGAGHKSHWDIPIEEISGLEGASETGKPGDKALPPQPDQLRPALVDSQTLEAAIEKALDRKLKPVMKLLAESKQPGPSLPDILGGIGYIIGLVGLAAYFKSRKKE